MSSAKPIGAALAALVLVLALLAASQGEPTVALPQRVAIAAPSEPSTAQVETPAPPPVATSPAERVTLELGDPSTLAAAAQIAEAGLQLRQQAREQELPRDPADLLRALEGQLRQRPTDARRVLEVLRREPDPTRVFVMARALGPRLDDPELRRETIEVLEGLPPRRRAAGLVVLLGRTEPAVLAFAVDQLERETDPSLRGRAASLLAHVVDELPPERAQPAQRAARDVLHDPGSPPEVVSGAADLLGGEGATATDRELLFARLDATRDPSALSSLVLGLCESGVHADQILERLARIEDQPDSPPGLRRVIDQIRGAFAAR